MKSLMDDLSKMSTYEKYKLLVDFLRFCATLLAPFMIVGLGHVAKHYFGW